MIFLVALIQPLHFDAEKKILQLCSKGQLLVDLFKESVIHSIAEGEGEIYPTTLTSSSIYQTMEYLSLVSFQFPKSMHTTCNIHEHIALGQISRILQVG